MPCKQIAGMKTNNCSLAVHPPSQTVRLIRYKVDLIQSCVESTLDVYRNRLPFVSKLLCIESKPPQSIPDCIAHMMRCTLGSIQHGRRVTQKSVLVPYIIEVLIKEIALLLEN